MKNKKEEKGQEKRIKYSFQAISKQNKLVKGYIDGTDKDEIKTFLTNEGYKKISIQAQTSILYLEIGKQKLKESELAFILTQLSTYLKAGIPLIDSVRILEKQATKEFQRRIFLDIIYELVKGESFSNSLESQGEVFPKLLISMVRTSEATGDLTTVLDQMTKYYAGIDKTKKQVVSSMTYPLIIFIFSIIVVTFILAYIVPEFVNLFNANNAKIPAITKFVIGASEFIKSNLLYIILFLTLFIIVFKMLYKHIKGFRKMIQSILMRMPIIGKVMIYKEVAMFTRTFSSLLEHKIFITDTMEILKGITSNVVFVEVIEKSLEYLSKGAKISDAFKDSSVFPTIAYEMIQTGESTGKLPLMMDYVADYYEDLYQNSMKRINTFIEPILIILLSVVVGVVILSIVVPMFSFYGQIG